MSLVRLTPLCVLLLAAACSGSSTKATLTPVSAPTSGGSIVVAGQTINAGGTFDATHHPVVAVTAEDFRFSPSVIIGTPGEVLTLQVTNSSQTKHNLKQPAQKADADLDPGAHATVTMTVPASGQLVFTCEYHAAHGMAGTVEKTGTAAAPAGSPSSGSDPYYK